MTSKHSSAHRLLSTGLFDILDSFSGLEARISALPGNKERGDAFEIFAEAYLATQKITLAQEVWPFESIPLEQRQALSLDTGRDMGVDGTYLTIDGELRAYQVKFRSNRPSLTWDELSTFMGLTDQVSQRVLFTNCEALPSLMQDRSGFIPIRGNDLDRLTAEDFEAMRQWLRSGQVKLPRKQPRPHQQEALTAIANGLAENDRATVVMACGTGKSLVALWAAEQHGCKNLLVPSLALVRQLLHEWLKETAWAQLTFMCVCSDPTVAKGVDDLIVHQADLDFPVTTESATVSRFLSKPFDGVKIVFSTYQSAQVVADGMPVGADGAIQSFDLAVFDEAHKTASREGTRFSFALADTNLPIRKRLFFTATPRYYDIRKKDKEGDNTLVYSMDKPEIYGPVVHTLSFAAAARRGIICDYKVVISVVTSAMVNDHLLQHGKVIVVGDTVKARQVALEIALQKAVEKYGVSRIFTFHGSVAAARSFTANEGEGIQQHLPEFTTLHVSGEMPTARREDHMKIFRKAKKAVMSNARCLTEGVDVPAVDMVAFISPRKSKVDIVQATGRAMRKSDETGKQFGYVMVPLFVEQAANESIEEALQRTGFGDIWDLLGAMKEQDDVLTDIIRQMREDKGRTGGYDESRFNERVEVLGPSVSLDTIRESITAECVERIGTFWDEMFGELSEYKAKHGHVNVPKTGLTSLDMWVSQQRFYKRTGKILFYREQRLNKIGFDWAPDQTEWEEKYNELVKYKSGHGHINVPRDGSRSLSSWVGTQRRRQKEQKLGAEKKRRLDEIGFEWDPFESKWESRFTELLAYKAIHGDTNVPELATGLYSWVCNQRQNRKNGILTPEKIARLSEISFQWNILESRWESRFIELAIYKDKNGDLDVPQRCPTGLGQWISTQRRNERNNKLTKEQKSRLEALGLSWNALDSEWEDLFSELLAFKNKHNHIMINRKENYELWQWMTVQRRSFSNGKLLPERQKKLDGIGFNWSALEYKWEEMFSELLAYQAEHGHVRVPATISRLGRWVSTQRAGYKDKSLSNERIERLEKIGFLWGIVRGR